ASSSSCSSVPTCLHALPTRRSSDLDASVGELLPVVEAVSRVMRTLEEAFAQRLGREHLPARWPERVVELRQKASPRSIGRDHDRSEEHTSELQSLRHLVCRLLRERK